MLNQKRAAATAASANAKTRRTAAHLSSRTPRHPCPDYWTTDMAEDAVPVTVVETRYMRRKLQHLLRASALHPTGECSFPGVKNPALNKARVIKVNRLENHARWQQYAQRREELRLKNRTPSATMKEEAQGLESKPIRCELADDERFLFHGTAPDAAALIAESGFSLPKQGTTNGRYGNGVYFTDQSCKAQQYTSYEEDEYGGKVFCMMYCRVRRK